MIKKMKLLILATLLCSIFSTNLKALSKSLYSNKSSDILIDNYYIFDDWYYSYTPVYYTYTPTVYYYLCEWWWFPTACETTYIVYRQNELNKNSKEANKNSKIEKREININEANNQIKQLKKEIFGKENFSTENLRKNNKAYDPRWLLAQLKISRLLFLEDEVTKNNKTIFENSPSSHAIDSKKEEKKEEKKDSLKIEKKIN